MTKITDMKSLRAEIARLKGEAAGQEKVLRKDMEALREYFTAESIFWRSASRITGIALTDIPFLKEGIGIGISLLARRYIRRFGRKFRNNVSGIFTGIFDTLRSYTGKKSRGSGPSGT